MLHLISRSIFQDLPNNLFYGQTDGEDEDFNYVDIIAVQFKEETVFG